MSLHWPRKNLWLSPYVPFYVSSSVSFLISKQKQTVSFFFFLLLHKVRPFHIIDRKSVHTYLHSKELKDCVYLILLTNIYINIWSFQSNLEIPPLNVAAVGILDFPFASSFLNFLFLSFILGGFD